MPDVASMDVKIARAALALRIAKASDVIKAYGFAVVQAAIEKYFPEVWHANTRHLARRRGLEVCAHCAGVFMKRLERGLEDLRWRWPSA